MTIYAIVRGTGYLAATQVPYIPKTVFAVKIRSYVPAILHPFVLWTQVVPPLEFGALVVSADGDKAKISFGANRQHIQFTSTMNTQLNIDIHSDFKNLISITRISHLYALGDDCVESKYNTIALNAIPSKKHKKYPSYCDVEDPTKLK